MMLLDKARENAAAIRRIGASALEEARKTKSPIHYTDASLGDGIIREMPDGTRHRLMKQNGEEVVVESFGPRDRERT